MRRFTGGAVGLLAFLTMASASASAAPVTVGSPLTADFAEGETTNAGTITNLSFGPGANAVSPVTGAVVRWHLLKSKGGPFRLRVLRPGGGNVYTAVGSSAAVSATGGLDTYATAIPIQAGDSVGLDIIKDNKLGVSTTPTTSVAVWVPQLLEGIPRPYDTSQPGAEFAFNAEVQPQPTVTSIGPTSGSLKGGTNVTVSGTDFAGVSAVSFGGKPAPGFSVSSEGQLSAVAPPGSLGKVDITVTTVAGTSPLTLADRFTYTACVVPKLKAKTLKAAKKQLKKAGCKVGKVTKVDGVTAKTGEVVNQGKKAGKKLAPGTKVNVTLG